MEIPRITIGLTCFNAEDTIVRALYSALSQDWPEIEVIVVDDASTDDSWRRILKVANSDPRVKAFRHAENAGAATARNTIINAATGVYVAFFDDDDESMAQRVRVQYQLLDKYECAGMENPVACYASGVRRYPNGYEVQMPAIGSKPEIPAGEKVADFLLFNARQRGVFYGAGTPTCALMIKTETMRALGGFDESLRRVEDVEFAVRLALAGGHFIGCSECLFIQHSTNTPDKAPDINFESELRLVNKYSDYLMARNKYKYARDWFLIRYHHFSGNRLRFGIGLFLFLVRFPVSAIGHIFRSFPARWRHERKMRYGTGGKE